MTTYPPPAWNATHLRRCRGHYHVTVGWGTEEDPDDVDVTGCLTFEQASERMMRPDPELLAT